MAQSGHSLRRNNLSAFGQERTLRRVIATGLGALGLLGWRRKRKGAAIAAKSNHLIGFRKDRREAVFLIQERGH
jgi:hypothetical protein